MKGNFFMSCKSKALGLFLLRLAVGAVFVYAGYMKLMNPDMIIGMLQGLNYPAPAFMGWLLIIVELLGGLALILGVLTRWAAGLLAFVMLIAFLTVHISQPFEMSQQVIVLFAANLCLLFVGPGHFALMKEMCHKK